MRRNVLIFHLGALGDFVLTWPLALALARLYPQSRVFYVTHGDKGRLAERALRLDSTDIEAGWHALFSEAAMLAAPAAKLLTSAHTVVSFLSDGSDVWAQNVRRLNPAAALVTLKPATLSAPPVGEHAAAFIHRQLAAWPAIATAVSQILSSIAARGIGGRGKPDGSIVIHPGSGGAAKCWPLDRFLDLARRLREAGRTVRFLIGEAEAERWPRDAIDAIRQAAELQQPRTLSDLWDRVNTASAFVGNDSGPAHLAGVATVPTVVLFGPTTPDVWRPLGPTVLPLTAPAGLPGISVDQVFDALSSL